MDDREALARGAGLAATAEIVALLLPLVERDILDRGEARLIARKEGMRAWRAVMEGVEHAE